MYSLVYLKNAYIEKVSRIMSSSIEDICWVPINILRRLSGYVKDDRLGVVKVGGKEPQVGGYWHSLFMK